MRKLTWVLIFILLSSLFAGLSSALAQAEPPPVTIQVGEVDTRDFPTIRSSFTYRSPGNPPGKPFTADQVAIQENGVEIPVHDLETDYAGFDFALVVNPNFELTLRDGEGNSNYDKMLAALDSLNYTQAAANGDRYHLFINPGLAYTDLPAYSAILAALDAYQENMRVLKADLASLSAAITFLADKPAGTDKVLIYLAPPPLAQQQADFLALMNSAREAGIVVYAWLVSEPAALENERGAALVQAVESTGGIIFAYNGRVGLPDPSFYLAGLGYQYRFSYQSRITAGGSQSLEVVVTPAASPPQASAPKAFSLTLLPPNLAFLSLPETVDVFVDNEGGVTPANLPVSVQIDFKDGHPRGIVDAVLIANGKVIQTNTQAPYGEFVLPLESLIDQPSLALQVRIEDAMGFTNSSELATIPMTTSHEPLPLAQTWYKNPLIIGAIAAILAVIAGVIWLPGYLKKKAASAEPANEEAAPAKASIPADALPPATLTRLDDAGHPMPEKPFPMYHGITLIGRDADQTQLVVADPAVEPVHAQITFREGEQAFLTDFNTAAGSWVNFAPVGTKGVPLQHGDLIQIGSVRFRFSTRTRTKEAPGNKSVMAEETQDPTDSDQPE